MVVPDWTDQGATLCVASFRSRPTRICTLILTLHKYNNIHNTPLMSLRTPALPLDCGSFELQAVQSVRVTSFTFKNLRCFSISVVVRYLVNRSEGFAGPSIFWSFTRPRHTAS